MESKIKSISEDENTIELESGIVVIGIFDDMEGCRVCCFSEHFSDVCAKSLCVGDRRKDKRPTIFKLQ